MRKSCLAVCLPAAVILLFPQVSFGQALPEFPSGRLTGAVVSTADPSQRYAVYVPSTFDGTAKMPILFVLDYRGRARIAAQTFIEPAERFGWIVMSAMNSVSDETSLPTVKALQAMWKDAHDRLPIDARRVYVAGLSGTARTATWVASQVPGSIAGVIGAAAGFSPLSPPSASAPFLYFATVGDVDYNYWEMRQLESRLHELKRPNRVEYFSGGHGWMPPRLAMSAIEWMELHAMQAGLRRSDRSLVDSWWWRDLSAAESFEEAGQELTAAFRLQAMTRDYAGLRTPAQMEDLAGRVARLSVNPLVSAGKRARDEGAARHEARLERLLKVLADAFPEGEDIAAQSVDATLRALGIADLRKTAAGPVPAAALEAERVLAELDVQLGFYLPVEALRVDDDARAAFYLEVHAAIDPTDSFAFFLRGKTRARAGRHGPAVEALRQAVQFGFRSVDLIDTDPAFAPMRGRPEFHALLAELRAWWEAQDAR